jgi:glucokinase
LVTAGVDLGGTKLLGLALDDGGSVVAEERVPTPTGEAAVMDALCELVTALAATTGPVTGIGVGVPGLVDRSGTLRVAPNLPGVADLDVRGTLAARFPGAAVRVDNDATCATWAEHRLGAARGVPDAVLVTLGTGIGGGLVAGGRLLRGANGFAGEVGHMVVDPNCQPCPCGKRGCWEQVASGSGLGRLGREAAEAGRASRIAELAGGAAAAVRGEHVTTAAAEGDEEAVVVMTRFGWWVALGLANLAAVLDARRFVLGGGLVEAGEVLLAPTRAAFAELVLGADQRAVSIVPAALGEHAGAIGAALLALEDGNDGPAGGG